MNILFVHSIGRNKFGGGEKWLITAAAGLRDNGHTVYIGGRSGSRLLKAALQRELKTVVLNIFSDISIYHVFSIASFLRSNKIDVIISKDRDIGVTGTAAILGGNPLVLVRHGLPLQSSFKKHAFLLRKLADGVITNTFTIKDLYETKKWVEKDFTRVIYNGIHATNNVPAYNFSEKFPGKKIVLSIGRLARQKGYKYLIDAISLLGNRHNDLMFVILGEGRHHSRLVSYAREKKVSGMIHFEGFVEDVVPYLKGCDIFVLPSLYEGMSNAAMEAMSCGKPVVLTKVNGAVELIPDEDKGILIPSGNAKAIADAVLKLSGDTDLCMKIGNEAKKHVIANFPVSGMILNLQQFIDERIGLKRQQSRKLC
jgi:glycosyltransferase involved in cell wall biosynthesis